MILKKYSICILIILICIDFGYGQEKRLEKANENFNRFAYVDARKIYLQVAESGYESLDLFKKLGDSYYFNAQLEDAVSWYEKLTTNYPNQVDPEYLFRYSQTLKSSKRYEEADRVMEQFNKIYEKDKRAEYFVSTRDYLKFIEMQSGRYEIEAMNVNSQFSDHAPSFNHQGQLVFASARNKASSMIKTIHEWDEMPFLDIYEADLSESSKESSDSKRLKGKINTRFHESSTSFSKDGKTVYFTRNNFTKKKLGANEEGTILLKLYKASLEGDKWTNVEELPFNSNNYSVAHPALSADGKKLYFASDMPGSKGLSDLFVVDVYEDGTFGTPKNLGDKINTEGRETFPYVSDLGRLYFASDGHVGLGGLDVFVAIPNERGELSIPYNIGKPVNSPEDDFSFVLNEDTKIGYFASNRLGGKGSDDIYRFKQIKDLVTECNQYVSGVVTDANTREIIVNAEVLLMDAENNELKRILTDASGQYRFDIECDRSYALRAYKEKYTATEVILSSNNVFEFEHNLTMQLGTGGLENVSLKPGDDLSKLLKLETIYFDLNESFIRKDAEIELQKIIAALKEYPGLKIEVRSHTDSRANDSYNLKLSEKRAQSTVKYIIEKGGIDASRVTGRGYGEIELINRCNNNSKCSEEEHQRNRRSEFILVK